MEPTTLDDKFLQAAETFAISFIGYWESGKPADPDYKNTFLASIKLALSEHLPDTYDEYGMGKDAQQYLSELKKMLK